jgi:AcrR family transcriptional regulator
VSPHDRRALTPVAPRPVPPTRSDRVDQIVAAARQIVETVGVDSLTMRRLGDELGIKAPSLYKHLPSRDAVVVQLVDETLFESGDRMHAAVSAPAADAAGGPVPALLGAYREFGRAHPNLYRLVTTGTLPRPALTPGLEDWAGEPFYRATADPYLAQALWAFAHGALILEIEERFVPGSDLDRTWQAGAHAFARAGAAWTALIEPIAQ